jgi:hypothetical protein
MESRVARLFLMQHTKTGKIYLNGEIEPNRHKIPLMAGKLTKMAINIPTSSIARTSKIYPNWDIWFENIPSGNPDGEPHKYVIAVTKLLISK